VPTCAYQPQAGDILFFTDYSKIWAVLFAIARAGHPYHSGIVIQLPDGSFRSLEAGFNDTTKVEVGELEPRLHSWHGPIWVRRRRTPLTPEQSARLTEFALRQDKKRYALIRLFGQMTPFRSRGYVRTNFLGGPHGERSAYFCSECVLEACVYA